MSKFPFDNQARNSVELPMFDINMADNYAVTEDVAGATAIANVTSDIDLPEKVTMRYQPLDKVSTGLELCNLRSTKSGYQIVIKDEFACRSTDDAGVVHDDPMTVYLTIRTTKGNPTMRKGADVIKAVEHLLSFIIEHDAGTVTSDQKILDRLMHSATKPLELV